MQRLLLGVSGIFMETHPDPDKALSDGPNSWPLDKMAALLRTLKAIDAVYKETGEIGLKFFGSKNHTR